MILKPGDLDYLTDHDRETLAQIFAIAAAAIELQLPGKTETETEAMKTLMDRLDNCAGIALLVPSE